MRRVRGRSRDPDSSGRADRRSTPSATVAAARRRSAASGLLARDRRASLGSGALRRLAQRLRAPLADAISRALWHAGSRTSQRAARRTDRREPVSEAASHRRRESLRRALTKKWRGQRGARGARRVFWSGFSTPASRYRDGSSDGTRIEFRLEALTARAHVAEPASSESARTPKNSSLRALRTLRPPRLWCFGLVSRRPRRPE